MEKIFAVALSLMMSSLMLSACNQLNPDDLVFDGKCDLDDDSIFFAVIDGVRYDLSTKYQDFLDAGYAAAPGTDMGRMVDAGYFGNIVMCKDGAPCFEISLANRTNKPVHLYDCADLIGIRFGTGLEGDWRSNIKVVGDLGIGSTQADVIEIFGGDYLLKDEYNIEYRVRKRWSWGAYVPEYGSYRFQFQDGKASGIMWLGKMK